MAQETDVWTQGQGPIAPEFWFSALKALFWKSNFQFFSKFSILGIFWLKNSFPEQKNRKNLNFLKSPAKSFCVPLSVPNSSPHSLGMLWVPLGSPESRICFLRHGCTCITFVVGNLGIPGIFVARNQLYGSRISTTSSWQTMVLEVPKTFRKSRGSC